MSEYKNIWALIEVADGQAKSISLEMLVGGRKLYRDQVLAVIRRRQVPALPQRDPHRLEVTGTDDPILGHSVAAERQRCGTLQVK